MKNLLQDLRYALRISRKSPGFTAVAVTTLALGIGANTAIFSLINAIMLRTLPVSNPQTLVELKWKAHQSPATTASFFFDNCPHGGGSWNGRTVISQRPIDVEGCSFSYPAFQEIQKQNLIFTSVFAFFPERLAMNSRGRTSQRQGLLVSGDFFSALGAHAAFGRLLGPTDDAEGATPAIVVSHRFWQNELGGDLSVVGTHVVVGKASFAVIGVADERFPDLDPGLPCDFWIPLAYQSLVEPRLPAKADANAFWVELMARLKPGVSLSHAASATSVLFAALTANGPEAIFKPGAAPQIELSTASHGLVTLRQNFSRPLFVLLAAVAIVLLVSCANMAGLMLARSAARRKELAMRVALGATWGRIIRQLLTESLLLSLTGGAAGILLGYLGAGALASFLSHNWYFPLQVDVHPDSRVLAFTMLVSVLVGVAFGFAPAFSSGRLDLVTAVKESAGNAVTPARRRINLGSSLVAVQIALTMLVLAGTGLLVRTLAGLRAESIGFDPQKVVVFRVDATYANRAGEDLQTLYRDLQEHLSSLPGITSASRSGVLPLSGGGMGGSLFSRDQSGAEIHVNWLPVAGSFFETMRLSLLDGRTLTPQDSEANGTKILPKPVVVNQALARRLFGTQNPVGRHFRADETGPENEIVGVVANAKYANVRDESGPTIYTPIGTWDGEFYFEVRTAMNPKAMMPRIRAAIARFDPNLLVTDMKTQQEQIDQNIYQERLIANLSSLFALLALIVACVGIYGLLSYQVTRRTQEIGIRLALGARREDVLRIVLRQGAVLAVLGAVIGAIAALAVTRYLQSFLFGVKPNDPLTMLVVSFLLIAVALLASYIPARRAMKTDPMVALRYE